MRRIGALLASAFLLCSAPALGVPDGLGIDSTGCSPCHGSASPGLVITISGPAALEPGGVGSYFVSIPPTLVGAGIAAEVIGGGSIDAVDVGTQLVGGSVVTHSQRNDGVYGYNVEVTAPGTEGIVSLDAAMLAYDDAGGAAGDMWNTDSMDIMVEVPEPTMALQLLAGLPPLAAGALLRRRKRG